MDKMDSDPSSLDGESTCSRFAGSLCYIALVKGKGPGSNRTPASFFSEKKPLKFSWSLTWRMNRWLWGICDVITSMNIILRRLITCMPIKNSYFKLKSCMQCTCMQCIFTDLRCSQRLHTCTVRTYDTHSLLGCEIYSSYAILPKPSRMVFWLQICGIYPCR